MGRRREVKTLEKSRQSKGDLDLMTTWQKYLTAHSIDEALHALASAGAAVRPVGGGTDLLLELQQGAHAPIHTLVDISNIPEMQKLEVRNDRLYIGAAVTVRSVTESPLIRQHARAVSEACNLIGGPQVRNTATLGGNVAHSLPAADGMISLMAFDTQVEIASAEGLRLQPMTSLFAGPGKSTLVTEKEILAGFYLPLRKAHQGSAFSRIMRPQGVALPVLNLAVWLERDGDTVEDIRIAFGPSGPVPVRAVAVEAALRGKTLSTESMAAARQAIHETVPFRTSAQRATAEYRHHLSEVLLDDVIGKAWQRAEEAA